MTRTPCIGRANKFLASRVTAIATGFSKVRGAEMFVAKTVETGSPVRELVRLGGGDALSGARRG